LNLAKSALAVVQLLLLSYSFTAQALSAQTSKVIEGTAPYFTFDNGLNKVTTTNDLLGITLSDGTKITPQTNNSAITPIVLPKTGETLADVNMLVPSSANLISLRALTQAPYNYSRDDWNGNTFQTKKLRGKCFLNSTGGK
jgi:hypothetical protein